jgi:hypothetical protein
MQEKLQLVPASFVARAGLRISVVSYLVELVLCITKSKYINTNMKIKYSPLNTTCIYVSIEELRVSANQITVTRPHN